MKPELNKKQYHRGTMDVRANDNGTYELSVCSDTPYMRPFGWEILQCAQGSVDMARFDQKAVPFIWGHDTDLPALGIVEAFRMDGGKGIATVRFTESNELARNTKAAVIDGTQRNVSIGYMVDEWSELPMTGTDGLPIYVATRYTIFEVSAVTVPADAGVGFGRADVIAAYRDFQTKNNEVKAVKNTTTDPAPLIIEDKTRSEDNPDDPDDDGDDDTDDPEDVLDDGTEVDDSEEEKEGYEEEQKSLAVATQTPPTKAQVMEIKMSDEKKTAEAATAFAELADWAEKNGLTANLGKWAREGYTLDKAKAEAFDIRSNASKVNIPVDIRVEQPLTKDDQKELSIVRAVSGLKTGATSTLKEEGDKFAREHGYSTAQNELYVPMNLPIFKRTMTTLAGGNGANFVANEYVDAEKALREGTVVGRLGIEIMTGVNGIVTLPCVTTGSAFVWQNETGSLSDTDLTTVLRQWTPKVATVSIPWSITLDNLNQPYSMEAIARTDILGALLEGFEGAVLAGSGASNTPTGLLNDTNIPLALSGSSGVFDSTRAMNIWKQQRLVHGSQNNFSYVVTPTSYGTGLTRVGFTGSFVASITQTGPGSGLVNGYPVYASTFVSTATYANGIVAGDFSSVLSTVFFIKIVRDDWSGMANATVKLRGFLGMDSKARQPMNLVRDLYCTG